ncbi:MAG TPA: hypothetical protein VIE36_11260 [Methylomirabilota bacterium]
MRLLVVGLLALVAASPAVAQVVASYEAPGTYKPADVLPKELTRGPRWEVQNPVVADGYMFRFKVRSDYGMFDAAGTGALRKLIGEIAAIGKLKEIRASKAFATAVADSATGPFRFAKNLIVHPVDTLTGVPKGMYKLTEDVAETIATEKNPTDDPVYKKALLVSGRKREYAAQLGVDVYSSNKVLQEELNSVGWAAAVGNLTVSAALMPVGGAAGTALTGVRWSNAVNDYMKAEPAGRLKVIAEDKLKEAGLSAELTRRFVNQTRFTPRHYILIAESLARLGPPPARGREAFLETALGAEDETDANYYAAVAQLLRGYHETVSPIVDLRMSRRIAVARAQNGNTVVPLPVDFLFWTETVDQRSGELAAAHRDSGATGQVQLWLTGTATRPGMQQLVGRRIAVIEDARRRVEILD